MGESIREAIEWTGGLVRLLLIALGQGVRRPYGIYDIFYQIVAQGVRSLPLTFVMSLFIGMVLTYQFGEALMWFGAKNAVGSAASLALVREIVPVIISTVWRACLIRSSIFCCPSRSG